MVMGCRVLALTTSPVVSLVATRLQPSGLLSDEEGGQWLSLLLRQRDSGTPPTTPHQARGPGHPTQAGGPPPAPPPRLGEGAPGMCPAGHPGWQAIPAGPQ